MTPRKVKAWRLRLDMSQSEFGTWLGVSRSTVNRWEGGTQAIPKMLGVLWGSNKARDELIGLLCAD
jgi:DNA-binding transcriptional regulator YiaG